MDRKGASRSVDASVVDPSVTSLSGYREESGLYVSTVPRVRGKRVCEGSIFLTKLLFGMYSTNARFLAIDASSPFFDVASFFPFVDGGGIIFVSELSLASKFVNRFTGSVVGP